MYNTKTGSIYCPRGYMLLYRPEAIIRVYFIINKTLAAEDWAYKFYDAYVATIMLCLDDTDVTIIIYIIRLVTAAAIN